MRRSRITLNSLLGRLRSGGEWILARITSCVYAQIRRQPLSAGEVTEFLPAALAIQKRPPSPVGRYLMWALLALFSLGVGWMIVGQVDIVAVAPGKVIPSGKSKAIQPMISASIQQIHVSEGQEVEKGQLLVTLDASQAMARGEQIESQLAVARAGQWRTQQLLQNLDSNESLTADLEVPSSYSTLATTTKVPEAILMAEWKLAYRQHKALQAEYQTIAYTLRERQSEYRALQNEAEKWRQSMPLVTARSDNHKQLASEKHVSQDSWLHIEQQRIEMQQNLLAAEHRQAQLHAATQALASQQQQLLASQRAQWQGEQHQFDTEILQLEQDTVVASTAIEAHLLRAPVNGTVQQLMINTIGGVVTQAQRLMVVVPNDAQLQVEAQLANKDIGFVEIGQRVRVKVDAFPFTRYGTIDGVVRSISHDVVEESQGVWVYRMQVAIASSSLIVEDKSVLLSAGMSVSVEIKTGKRQLMEYVLSPLLRYRDESARQR